MLKRLLAVAAFFAALLPFSAAAQSGCSYITYQAILTPGQWQQCFQGKLDNPGAPPITTITAISPLSVVQSGFGATISIGSPIPVSLGGTGGASFTANLPLIGNGSSALAQGSVTGNTAKFATSTGALTPGDCVKIDANGNFVDQGSGCGSGTTTAFVDDFVAGTNFTPGVTTSLVLSHTPANAQILAVSFDGVTQAHTTYNLSTATVTFNAAIPANTQIVEAQYIVASTTAGISSITTGATTLTGAVNFIAGSGVSITPSGQNLTFAVSSAVASVSNSDGSLTISPTSGAVVASLNTAHSNNFSVFQTVTVANAVGLFLDTPSAGQVNAIQFNDHGTGKWQIAKGSSNDFELFDIAASRFVIQGISNGLLKLMPNSGATTNGVAMYADLSGHPHCDVRAFGALGNAPTSNATDQAAVASAYSTCSGGKVYFPCGNYGNTATWQVVAGTHTEGAGADCAVITTTQTNGDVFLCVAGGAYHTTFNDIQIAGPGQNFSGFPVPTGGYAIDCPVASNQQHYDHVEIIGLFNGIYLGGTNGQLTNSRFEQLYGPLLVYEPVGGNHIEGNQFDNNHDFLTNNGTLISYNPGGVQTVATGTLASSNGGLFLAVSGGNTCPTGGGLVPALMFSNIGDCGVTWHYIGSSTLVSVWPGTETWILDNDFTALANYSILLDGIYTGHTGAQRVWIRGNDFAGSVTAAVGFEFDADNNHVLDNQFQMIGFVTSGVSSGFSIWDLGGPGCTPTPCTNQNNEITNNTFISLITDAAILVSGSLWTISNNLIDHNNTTTQFCGITLFSSGGNPTGTNIVGNIMVGGGSQICTNGGSASNTVVLGNSVFGGTVSISGTSLINNL